MTFEIRVSGEAREAVARHVPQLVSDLVASRITSLDPTLWGPDAEAEAAVRLGWTEAAANSLPLVPLIAELRQRLRSDGADHVVLSGMGGSSLAPEVIARTAGIELTILDTTDPAQVRQTIDDRLASTVLVVSSKSGSTVETDSHRRLYEQAFRDAGIDPAARIVVVTDPGSPLDAAAREAGYTVFNADPNVGGRYSALTAFGLVPVGLAGYDVEELLHEAEAVSLQVAVDEESNPALILGAAIAGTSPLRDKLGLVADGTPLVGFPDWAEQLIAESTGKSGTGLLPVVLDVVSPELTEKPADLQVVRFVANAAEHHLFRTDRHVGEILVSGSLGSMFLVWEYAVAVAGRLLGVDPFDQPDVESAKAAARGLLDARPVPSAPAFVDGGIEVRADAALLGGAESVGAAIEALLAQLPADGYVAVQAYANRETLPQLTGLRDLLAARANRPVTFGWGPRFLHSTGQFHKGGPAVGVFLQVLTAERDDVPVPGRPFSFGTLIAAQAAGDAEVLGEHGRPVLTLTLTDPEADIVVLFGAIDD